MGLNSKPIRTYPFYGGTQEACLFSMGMDASGSNMMTRWGILSSYAANGEPTGATQFNQYTFLGYTDSNGDVAVDRFNGGVTALNTWTGIKAMVGGVPMITSQDWGATEANPEKRKRAVAVAKNGIVDIWRDGITWTPSASYSEYITGGSTTAPCKFYYQDTKAPTNRPIERFGDYIIIGDKNYLASFNTRDLVKGWSQKSIEFPYNLTITGIASGTNGFLVAFDDGDRGVIRLCSEDANLALDSKGEFISLDEKIENIVEYRGTWYIITPRTTYQTNGYYISEWTPDIDPSISSTNFEIPNGGIDVSSKTIAMANNIDQNGFKKSGFNIIDMPSKKFTYVPGVDKSQAGNQNGIVSYNTAAAGFVVSTGDKVGILSNNAVTDNSIWVSQLIREGNIQKICEGIEIDALIPHYKTDQLNNKSVTIDVKLADNKRTLNISATNLDPVNAGDSYVTVTNDIAQLGDEVTILDGENAGFIAHITEIIDSGGNYQLNLDTPLPYNLLAGAILTLTPFKKAGTIYI